MMRLYRRIELQSESKQSSVFMQDGRDSLVLTSTSSRMS